MNARVLLVDDEANVLSTLKRLLRKEDVDVVTAPGGREGLDVLAEKNCDLIVSDMRMPSMNGAEFLSIVKEKYPMTERILLTGYSDMDDTIDAINDGGIYGYVAKPWDPKQLLSLIHNGIAKAKRNKKKNRVLHHFKRENDALEKELDRKEREMAQTVAFVDFAKKQIDEKRKAQEIIAQQQAALAAKQAEQQAAQQAKDRAAYADVSQALEDSYMVVEQLLLNLMDLKLAGQRDINQRVAEVVTGLAHALGLDDAQSAMLRRAARLHAIGKIGVPDAVLVKAFTQLEGEELALYKQYPANSACTLMAMMPFQDVAQLLFNQREYLDGSGFPNGLAGSELDTPSRVLCAAIDYIEYRVGHHTGEPMSHDDTLTVMQRCAKRYDERVLVALASLTLEIEVRGEGKELLLPVHSLVEGMVLIDDIISQAGILLLRGGTVLNDASIRHLAKLQANLAEKLVVNVRFQSD